LFLAVVVVIPKKVEYLLALAKEEHFARAASACNVSQPTLSAGIRQLESELGIQIANRGRRFKGFTEDGEIVLAWARQTAAECDRLTQKLRDRNAGSAGTLRIGLLGSAVPLLPFFTRPFRRLHPRTNLRIMAQNAFDIQKGLEDSTIDVAITYLAEKALHNTRTHPLYTEEYELLVRRGTFLSGEKRASWDAITEWPLCMLSVGPPIGAEESEILNNALTKTPHIITNAIWLVMDHVRTGEWASVLPRPVRVMISGDSQLEAIPLAKTGTAPTMGIAIPTRQSASGLAETFFHIATSRQTLEKVNEFLRPDGSPAKSHATSRGRQPSATFKHDAIPKKRRTNASSKAVGSRS
jgi:DNA-binding transcriptional LysR family regulator